MGNLGRVMADGKVRGVEFTCLRMSPAVPTPDLPLAGMGARLLVMTFGTRKGLKSLSHSFPSCHMATAWSLTVSLPAWLPGLCSLVPFPTAFALSCRQHPLSSTLSVSASWAQVCVKCLELGERRLADLLGFPCFPLQVIFHDVAVLTDKLFPVVEAMQKYFSAGSGTYYSDSIFFLSVAMHQIMPKGNQIDHGQRPGVSGLRMAYPLFLREAGSRDLQVARCSFAPLLDLLVL